MGDGKNHKTLQLQLSELGLSAEDLPKDLEAWQKLLETIAITYHNHEDSHAILERSLDDSSSEINEYHQRSLNNAKLVAMGEMSAGIVHEINNPLAAISGYTENLEMQLEQRDGDFGMEMKFCQRIDANIELINQIIKGMKNVARDGDQDAFEKVPFKEIVSQTIAIVRARNKRSMVNITVSECEDDLLAYCRQAQIAQILINILNNAVDAVEESENPWVKLVVKKNGNWIEVRVIDSGCGIPKDVAAKIFEPFFTTKAPGKGTGLGLSISRGIIRSHSGDFYLDEMSTNTCFVVRLPVYHEGLHVA